MFITLMPLCDVTISNGAWRMDDDMNIYSADFVVEQKLWMASIMVK